MIAHAAGREPHNLHDVARQPWVGYVLRMQIPQNLSQWQVRNYCTVDDLGHDLSDLSEVWKVGYYGSIIYLVYSKRNWNACLPSRGVHTQHLLLPSEGPYLNSIVLVSQHMSTSPKNRFLEKVYLLNPIKNPKAYLH